MQGEGKVPIEPLQEVEAVCLVRMDQGLSLALAL
jgi:hypothetical protein